MAERSAQFNRAIAQPGPGASRSPSGRDEARPSAISAFASQQPSFAERLLALQAQLSQQRSTDPALAFSALDAAESVLSGELINPVPAVPAGSAEPSAAAPRRPAAFPAEGVGTAVAPVAPLKLSLLPDVVLAPASEALALSAASPSLSAQYVPLVAQRRGALTGPAASGVPALVDRAQWTSNMCIRGSHRLCTQCGMATRKPAVACLNCAANLEEQMLQAAHSAAASKHTPCMRALRDAAAASEHTPCMRVLHRHGD